VNNREQQVAFNTDVWCANVIYVNAAMSNTCMWVACHAGKSAALAKTWSGRDVFIEFVPVSHFGDHNGDVSGLLLHGHAW